MYCSKCGKVLPDNAKFCSSCGQTTNNSQSNQNQPSSGNNQQTPPSNNRNSNTQYGQVIKCPACGGMINPFQAQCSCGYVFRGTSHATAVADLAQELQDIDMQNSGNPYASQFNNGINVFEQQKVSVITNFIIPNLKEELIEFVLLARVHLAKIYADKKRPKNDELYNAWKTKFEECHIKAKMMLSSGDLALFNSTEKEMQSYESKLQAKKSKIRLFSIIGIVVSSIQLMASISSIIIPCIVLSVFELGAFVLTLLLETKVIKTQNVIFKIISLIVGIILCFANVGIMSTSNLQSGKETIVWEDIILNEYAPPIKGSSARVMTNSREEFYIYDIKCSQSEFYDYVNNCKEHGYNYEIMEEDEHSYVAYNESGYKIDVSYIVTLSVNLSIPIPMSTIQWPNSDIAKLIPKPNSLKGKIEWEHDYGFVIYVTDITKTEYKDYVNSVFNNGFNIDYSKGDTYFWADNVDGYHVHIKYEGYNTIWIRIDEPDDN